MPRDSRMTSTNSFYRRWAVSPSNWLAVCVGIGLVCSITKTAQSTQAPKVIVGSQDEVVYFHSATREDATALGQALKNIGYFTDKGSGVVLDKTRGGTTVSFVLGDGAWSQPDAVSDYGEVARLIAPAVGGFPFKVRLVDQKLAVRRDLAIGKEVVGMRDTIFYYGSATQQEAKTLGQQLRSAGAMRDTGMTVVLAKGDVTTLSFVVNQNPWERPEALSAFEALTRQVSPTVGGLPVRLRFLDKSGRRRKEVSIE
jgi:hypothetical protein